MGNTVGGLSFVNFEGTRWCCPPQGSSISGVVDEGGNKGNDDENGYGGGNGVFSSIYDLFASKSGMKLLKVE